MTTKSSESIAARPVGRDTIRSRLVLEVASEMVDQKEWSHRQARVSLRPQGAEEWVVNMIASDGPGALDLVARGEMQLAISNPAMYLALAVRGTGPYKQPIPLRAIIGINLVVWLVVQGAGADLPLAKSVCNLGLIPGELTGLVPPGRGFPMGPGAVCLTDPGRQASHLITSMFLHGGWMHLIGNMWFLWIFGNNVEDSMGRLRFVAFYLLTGLAAALGQVITSPDSIVPMVGASGAISGVMGAYLVLYPRVRVYALIPIFVFFTSIALPAWAMLGYWFLLQLASGLFSSSEMGGVAFWAHIGGFVAGVVLVKLFARDDYVAAHRAHHWRPQRILAG